MVLAVVAGATTMLGGSGGSGRPANAPPSATPSDTSRAGAAAKLAGVRWAGAWDAQHLYAGVRHCRNDLTCTDQLLGSEDGGRTWTQRSTDQDLTDTYVIGAQTLVTGKSHEQPLSTPSDGSSVRLGGGELTYQLSTDGGRHWADLTLGDQAVAAVPAGGYLLCVSGSGPSGKYYAVDLVHLRMAPLDTVPAAVSDSFGMGPQASSRPLWAVGAVGSGIVSVSTDSGHTWQARTFDPSCPTYLSVWPGGQPGTAGVLCDASGSGAVFRGYRTTDSGATWQSIAMPQQQPFDGSPDEKHAFMLQDGTVVVAQYPIDDSVVKLWALAPGGTSWQPVPTSGLPAYAVIFEFGHDGTILAHGSGVGHFDMYRSTDLRTWTKLDTGS